MSGDPYIKENERLEAEIARLRADYLEAAECTAGLLNQIEKLRAVLEEIATGKLHPMDVTRKARNALANKEDAASDDNVDMSHERFP